MSAQAKIARARSARRRASLPSEDDVQAMFSQHIEWHGAALRRLRAVWTFNYLAGVRLPLHIAVRAKRLGVKRALPDFEMKLRAGEHVGLAIELKRPDVKLTKLNGEWATKHIAEQADTLASLREQGWRAEFALGYDEARRMFDAYLARAEADRK